jgi:hypothetical protein
MDFWTTEGGCPQLHRRIIGKGECLICLIKPFLPAKCAGLMVSGDRVQRHQHFAQDRDQGDLSVVSQFENPKNETALEALALDC